MKTTPAIDGNGYIGTIINEARALLEAYPAERVRATREAMEQIEMESAPDELKLDAANLDRLAYLLEREIPKQTSARRDDDLGLTKDELLALCENIIRLEIVHNNTFDKPVAAFLTKQLCGLSTSPFDETEALAWVQGKLDAHGANEGYLVEMNECDCENCVAAGITLCFKITNAVAREQSREQSRERRSSGIGVQIIEIGGRSRGGGLGEMLAEALAGASRR